MDYQELQHAIKEGTPLVWNDPLPIEGNDYTITSINLPELEDDMCASDLIITIQYGGGSEAEVLIHEISPKFPEGETFKSEEAFESKKGFCYSPELSEEGYTYDDFLRLAKELFEEHKVEGNPEKLARNIFDICQWQHPETVIDETDWDEEFSEYGASQGIL